MEVRCHGFPVTPLNWMGISLVLLFFFPSLSFAAPFKVTFILSHDSPVYTNTLDNIKSTITNKPWSNISTNVINIKKVKLLSDDALHRTDLFVPIGQASFKEIIKHADSNAILATLIPHNSYLSIRSSNKEAQPRNKSIIGAIFLDQPNDRLIALTRLVLPNIKHAGILIKSTESQENRKSLIKAFYKNNLIHHIEGISHSDNIMRKITSMLDEIDVLIATPDPLIFNKRTARNILLSTYRQRVPVIGFSYSYVKAGALASAYTTPQQIGRQTGELILRLAKQGAITSLPTEYAKYFSIATNPQVARSLNLPNIDQSIIRDSIINLEARKRD